MAGDSAREMALAALRDRQGNVTAHLARLLAERSPSPAEAALATELAHGVVRRRRTLDTIARAYSRRPERQPPAAVRELLRLGLYQLIFTDRIPAFAAINEAVKTCRRRHAAHAGFVNGLLRNVARSLGPAAAGEASGSRRLVPLTAETVRPLDRDVFADPAAAPAIFLAEACSLPDVLAGRWLARFGSVSAAFRRAMQVNARPPVVVRVNPARATVEAVLAELGAAGVEAVAHENGVSVVLTAHANVAALPAFQAGRITPQDATATAAAMAVGAAPGMRVLDLCAAPGAKTTCLAERMGGAGEIVAADVNAAKLARVDAGCRRCGVTIVRTCTAEQVGSLSPGSFDRVLVDAPCSNTGVLARRIEARWRFRADRLGRLAADQRALLGTAAIFAAPGGRVLYSTCSLEAEENEQVVRAFTRRDSRWRLTGQKRTYPSGFGPPSKFRDGGYWAALDG